MELEYAKQMMLKAFAYHLLIDAQADHKQWLLANFPPSLYNWAFILILNPKHSPVPATGK